MNAGTPICLCEKCAEGIEYYNNRVNFLSLPENLKTYCDGIICVGRYTDYLKNSLKRFKFSNKASYHRAFGKLLALKVQSTLNLEDIDLIIPVPLHTTRKKLRGYNQSELIAGYAAKILNIPMKTSILTKNSGSQNQSALGRNERLFNLEGAFDIKIPEAVKNKNILLIDDIVTTGSTVNECSKALKQAGAVRVIAGIIATTRQNT